MKKIRQYVAMAAAAVMIASVVPAKITYADEILDSAIENNVVTEDENNEVEDLVENMDLIEDSICEVNLSDSSLEVINVNENSAWIQVNNIQGGFSHIVISYAAKNAPDDCGTKILTSTTSGNIAGLRSNTEYEVKAYQINVSSGSNTGASSTSTYLGSITFKTLPGDFLILVGEDLHENSNIQKSLKTYTQDIANEGINGEVIRISKTKGTADGSDGIYNCTEPEDLKAVIKNRYENGAKGFVIVGCSKDIPTAYFKESYDDSYGAPTDEYYADIDGVWKDNNGDNCYEELGNGPDMYFGRIDTQATAAVMGKSEAELTESYLNRIHEYRQKGSNLTAEAQDRGLCFVDNKDFRSNTKPQTIGAMSSAISNIEGVYDENETCKQNWIDKLNEGYALVHLTSHSSAKLNSFSTIGKDVEWIQANEVLTSNNINPKFNFMNLHACSACNFDEQYGEPITNIGCSYLFKDTSTGLNVTGGTVKMGRYGVDKQFYNDIADKVIVGEAFKDSLKRKSLDDVVYMVLFGDPTIKYNLNKPADNDFILSDNFAGNNDKLLSVKAGNDFVIRLNYADNMHYELYIDGVKENSIYEKGKNIYWRVLPSLAENKIHKGRILTYTTDADGNKLTSYSETFNFNIENGEMKNNYPAYSYYISAVGGCGRLDFSTGRYLVMFDSPSIDNAMTYGGIYAENEGDYAVKLNYVNGAGQSALVSVDGSNDLPQNVTFDAGVTQKEVTLHLQKGYNDITIKAATDAGIPNMESLEVVQ